LEARAASSFSTGGGSGNCELCAWAIAAIAANTNAKAKIRFFMGSSPLELFLTPVALIGMNATATKKFGLAAIVPCEADPQEMKQEPTSR
jgi:hypothetical protein